MQVNATFFELDVSSNELDIHSWWYAGEELRNLPGSLPRVPYGLRLRNKSEHHGVEEESFPILDWIIN